MLPLPSFDMFPNRFVETIVPTKSQIFSRTGQRAVSPNGDYSGDEVCKLFRSPTESASDFVKSAESYESSKEDLPE